MDRRSNRFQAGLLAAVLAATLQFVLWAGVMAGSLGPATAAANPTARDQICFTTDASGHPHAPGPACLLCPVCLALSLPGALPAPSPALRPPLLAGAVPLSPIFTPIPPPPLALAAAYPRGPPLA